MKLYEIMYLSVHNWLGRNVSETVVYSVIVNCPLAKTAETANGNNEFNKSNS